MTHSRFHLSVSAEVWCTTGSEALIAFTSPCCFFVYISICVGVLLWHTDRSIFITLTDWGWCAPPLWGARSGAPYQQANTRCLIELFWWARREVHYNADTLIMCLHPLGSPLPSVSLQCYWSAFNAQTNSSLIVPVFFFFPFFFFYCLPHFPTQSSKEKRKENEMSWRKNFICSVNQERGSLLSKETIDRCFAVSFGKAFSLSGCRT